MSVAERVTALALRGRRRLQGRSISPLDDAADRGSNLTGANLSRYGDYNQRVVLQAIRAASPVTRAEIAARTGLTHQSIINITKRLIADGTVIEAGKTEGGRGQPAARMAINPNGAFALGLNIDRDHMTLLVMDLEGKVRSRIYTDKHFALPDDVVGFVVRSFDDLLQKRVMPKKRVIGLGIAMPEQLGGVEAPEKPGAYASWGEVDLAGLLSSALELPVFIENDAVSAAVGELQFGVGLHRPNFVYTLISAGLGCGLILRGQPYAGGLARAGDIGKIPVVAENGARKTLWDFVSIYALYAELEQRGYVISDPLSLVADDAGMMEGVDAWVRRAAAAMATVFLSMSYILSPEVHVIGGQLPAFVLERLCAALNARFDEEGANAPLARFFPSTAERDAAAVGGAVLVFQNCLLPGDGLNMEV